MPIDSSGRGRQQSKSSKGKSKGKRKGDGDDGGVSDRQHKKAALVAEESSLLPKPPPPLVSESESEPEIESESEESGREYPKSQKDLHCGICGKDGHYIGFCLYLWNFPPEGKLVDTERYRIVCECGNPVTGIEDGEDCCDCTPICSKRVSLKPKYQPKTTFLPFDPNRSPVFYSSDIEVLYSSSSDTD